ncbi:hypothetical protein ABFS83_03G103200 [Erythranthe nasuta]
MDWNDIHQDLLQLILSNVFAKDRYNFSLVSRFWNEVVAASPYRNSPCLVLRCNDFWRFFQHNTFFNMHFPKLKNARVRFSNHGWLLMMSLDNRTLFFFDPFNNQTIKLPDMPSKCDYTTICFFHPPTSSGCLIVGIASLTWNVNREVKIGVLKYGEDRWEDRIFRVRDVQFESHGAPIFHDGKIYFLDNKGNVAVFDMSNVFRPLIVHSWCLKKRRPHYRNIKEYFLVKPHGDETIFAVFVVQDERKVRVFKLMDDFKWKLVEDLGDMVFYVSNTSSFGYRTDKTNKNMANKIFFTKFHDDNVIFYSMKTHKYHSFGGDYSSDNCYDFRRLNFATSKTIVLGPTRGRN